MTCTTVTLFTSARPRPPGGVCLEAYLHTHAAYPINPSFTVMLGAKTMISSPKEAILNSVP